MEQFSRKATNLCVDDDGIVAGEDGGVFRVEAEEDGVGCLGCDCIICITANKN